ARCRAAPGHPTRFPLHRTLLDQPGALHHPPSRSSCRQSLSGPRRIAWFGKQVLEPETRLPSRSSYRPSFRSEFVEWRFIFSSHFVNPSYLFLGCRLPVGKGNDRCIGRGRTVLTSRKLLPRLPR